MNYLHLDFVRALLHRCFLLPHLALFLLTCVDAAAQQKSEQDADHLHDGKCQPYPSNGVGVLTDEGLCCVDAVLVVAGEWSAAHLGRTTAVRVLVGEAVVGGVAPVGAVQHTAALQLRGEGEEEGSAKPRLFFTISPPTHAVLHKVHCHVDR